MSKGYAIHVGLNSVDTDRYFGWDGLLRAAERDAKAVAAITRSVGFTTLVLLGQSATAEALVRQLKNAIRLCRAGDFLVVSFAGHGGFMKDPIGEAPDSLLKTWCLYDRQFFARELYYYLREINERARVFIRTDCCWSGSLTRTPTRGDVLESHRSTGLIRQCPLPVTSRYIRGIAIPEKLKRIVSISGLRLAIAAPSIVMAGAQANQSALELEDGGVFSRAFESIWSDGKFSGGHKKFLAAISAQMLSSQTPLMFCMGHDSQAVKQFLKQRPFVLQ